MLPAGDLLLSFTRLFLEYTRSYLRGTISFSVYPLLCNTLCCTNSGSGCHEIVSRCVTGVISAEFGSHCRCSETSNDVDSWRKRRDEYECERGDWRGPIEHHNCAGPSVQDADGGHDVRGEDCTDVDREHGTAG